MAETFLEEHLKRIREMSERMTRVRSRAAEVSAEAERDRAPIRHSPLHQVRDLRSPSSIEIDRPASGEDQRARPAGRASRRRRK